MLFSANWAWRVSVQNRLTNSASAPSTTCLIIHRFISPNSITGAAIPKILIHTCLMPMWLHLAISHKRVRRHDVLCLGGNYSFLLRTWGPQINQLDDGLSPSPSLTHRQDQCTWPDGEVFSVYLMKAIVMAETLSHLSLCPVWDGVGAKRWLKNRDRWLWKDHTVLAWCQSPVNLSLQSWMLQYDSVVPLRFVM